MFDFAVGDRELERRKKSHHDDNDKFFSYIENKFSDCDSTAWKYIPESDEWLSFDELTNSYI